MHEINYKQKYQELKLRYVNSVDVAFRLGFEQGMQEAKTQQVADQAQQAMQQPQPGQQPGVAPQPDQQASPDQQPEQVSENPHGTELDQHIAELESMLGKSELTGDDLVRAREYLQCITSLQKADPRSPKPVFAIGKQAAKNLDAASKESISMQQKIVDDVMAKWETEEKDTMSDIQTLLSNISSK